MSFVVTGVTGLANRGVEALVRPIVANLQELYPLDDIHVLTGDPDGDAARGQSAGCSFEKDPFQRRRRLKQPIADWTLRALYRETKNWKRTRRTISESRLIIATGGDIFSSDYGVQRRHLESLGSALDFGVPVVFLAHSIGPYRDSREAQEWLDIARKAAVVTLREEMSYTYVRNTLGLRGPRVEFTADPAFLLESVSPAIADRLISYYAPEGNNPLVGIAPSRGISRFKGLAKSGSETATRHLDLWVEVVRFLLDGLGTRVLLVPHVQTPGINDDRVICDDIVRRVGHDRRLTVAWGDLRAHEYKGLLSACALVMAERMHAGIGALSMNVPTILVGYSVKAEGILRQIARGNKDLSDCLIAFERFLNPGVAVEQIKKVWEAQESMRVLLEASIPEVQAKAKRNFEIIREVLGSR